MYTGTLIADLLETAARVRRRLRESESDNSNFLEEGNESLPYEVSESKQLPQPLGLSAADRDFGLFFVVHPQLIRALEPGNDLTDSIDVHQVGTVGAPKQICVETVQQLLERPAVGLSFHPRCARSHNCDHAVFDPRITDIFLVHQKHPASGF